MNIKRIISSIGIGAGAIIIGLGVQYAMANWIPAPGSPPNCSDPTIPGCNAPINVGTSAQAKNGSLSLGTSVATTSVSLDVEGKLSWLTGLIDNGPFQLIDAGALAGQDNGKVLTSDANGNASWQAGGGTHGTPVFIAPVVIASSSAGWTNSLSVGWTTVNLTSYGIPSTATAVIISGELATDANKPTALLQVRPSSTGNVYTMIVANTAQAGYSIHHTMQGIYPFKSGSPSSIDYTSTQGTDGWRLTLIGYIQ